MAFRTSKGGGRMNLVEHYIVEIYSIEDITKEFEEETGEKPRGKLFEVDLLYNCYGRKNRTTKIFAERELETTKKRGYYLD